MTLNQPNLQEESYMSSTNENYDSSDELETTTSATSSDIPSFGWSQYAERVNGRFAMLGFISILLIEIISHTTFLNWAGLIH